MEGLAPPALACARAEADSMRRIAGSRLSDPAPERLFAAAGTWLPDPAAGGADLAAEPGVAPLAVEAAAATCASPAPTGFFAEALLT